MEFGLVSFCIGPSPIVYLVKTASLALSTMVLAKFMRHVSGDSRLHPSWPKKSVRTISIVSLLIVGLLFGFASIIAARILFVIGLNILMGPGVCTGFVGMTRVEMFIPVIGGFLAAARNIDAKLFKILRYPLSWIFASLIVVSMFSGIQENFVLHDYSWNSTDFELGNSSYYEKFISRFHYFSLGVATFFAILFAYVLKKLGKFTPRRLPRLSVMIFLLGMCTSLLAGSIIYRELYWWCLHQTSGLLFACIIPGVQTQLIPPIGFAVAWCLSKDSREKLIEFYERWRKIDYENAAVRIKLEQIRIASPCPAFWKDMLGDDRVRFCHICSEKAYNLSHITKAEVEELMTLKNSKVCEYIYVRKDGAIMTSDCTVGLTSIQRLVRRVHTYSLKFRTKVPL